MVARVEINSREYVARKDKRKFQGVPQLQATALQDTKR